MCLWSRQVFTILLKLKIASVICKDCRCIRQTQSCQKQPTLSLCQFYACPGVYFMTCLFRQTVMVWRSKKQYRKIKIMFSRTPISEFQINGALNLNFRCYEQPAKFFTTKQFEILLKNFFIHSCRKYLPINLAAVDTAKITIIYLCNLYLGI